MTSHPASTTHTKTVGAARFGLTLILVFGCAVTHATHWQVDGTNSRLGFTASYDGLDFDARFERFAADIRFDPSDLVSSRFEIDIDITSVNSDFLERDDAMRDVAWFNSDQFPDARFIATEFVQTSDGFEAIGRMTIKGIERQLRVPFRWQHTSVGVQLSASTVIKRTDYNIGDGEWLLDETVGFDVQVVADLKLTSK